MPLFILIFPISGYLTVYYVMSGSTHPQDRMLHWTKICEVTGEEEPMSRSKTFSGRDDDNLCLLLARGVLVAGAQDRRKCCHRP